MLADEAIGCALCACADAAKQSAAKGTSNSERVALNVLEFIVISSGLIQQSVRGGTPLPNLRPMGGGHL